MDPRNKRKQWGVRVVKPTSQHMAPSGYHHQIGYWKVIYRNSTPEPTELYYTRQEAEEKALACHKHNDWWEYAARKHNHHEKKP